MQALPVTILLAALSCIALPAIAVEATLAQIVEQQKSLTREMDEDAVKLTASQEREVRETQRRVFALVEGKTMLSELNVAEKVELENALEAINAQVKGGRSAGEERQVCKRVRRVGSNMTQTICSTQKEWEQVRQASRDSLEKMRTCDASGGGTCGQ